MPDDADIAGIREELRRAAQQPQPMAAAGSEPPAAWKPAEKRKQSAEAPGGFLDYILERITVRQLAFGAALFALTLIWAFFLSASGVVPSQFLLATKALGNMALLGSANFIIFLLVFPLCLALAALLCRSVEKKIARAVVLAPGAAAGLMALFLFSTFSANLFEFAVLGAFYFAALFTLVETAYMKLGELKKYVTARTVDAASSKATHLVAGGILIACILVALQNPQAYAQDFENLVMGALAGETGSAFTAMSADLVISTKAQTLDEITQGSEYAALEAKESDSEAQEFVQMLEAQKEFVSSDAYRQQLNAQLAGRKQEIVESGANVGELVKVRFPGFERFEQFVWAAQAIFVTLIFLAIANFIIRPLAFVYGLAIARLVPA